MTKHDRNEVLAKLNGRTVVCSVSGGKDSTAMALYLTRDLSLPDVRFVFADTGWEHPETYSYIRDVLTPLLGRVEWVGYAGGMGALVRKKGMFPSRVIRFCTEELKVKPILAFIDGMLDRGADCVNAVGIRAGESDARSKLTEWEFNRKMDLDVWRPLLAWSEADVIAQHSSHGVTPNPLYLRGASLVGCWPCIFSRKKEIQFVAAHTPKVVETIREMERDVQAAAAARYARLGETFDSKGYTGPTFFQASGRLRSEGKDGAMVPIDRVIEWANTAHGGRQFELFAPEIEQGCVRWGLCESMQKDEEGAP
jgi:3'-phosphoadenosine 5'-phosphosulfate sulfotransferase (PAPS reductase)/FAD synthetase